MTNITQSDNAELITVKSNESTAQLPNFDVFAGGIATGIVVTVIVETGKGALGILAKNPLFVFGAGFMSGYFAHKYRKEIILSSNKMTENTKDFVLQQKKNFIEMLGDSEK